MTRYSRIALLTLILAALLVLPSYGGGSSAEGSFDRVLNVSGPIRLELSNGSGDIQIKLGAEGKVHIHGDVKASWSLMGDAQKRAADVVANPPIEQKGNSIRIGKDSWRLKNLGISYIVEVPHDTEVDVSVASGSLFVGGVRGPVRASSASGSVRAEQIDRDAQLSSASGSVDAADIGDFLRVSNASGDAHVSNVKGDVRISVVSGDTRILNPGGRVEAGNVSGSIEIQGATSGVNANTVSGEITVQGDPSKGSYWEMKTVSGSINIGVRPGANFYLSADASSGEIRADIPIVIEEQGKHSLRAHVGNGGGRVEVHSGSGEIRIHAAP